MGGKAIVVARHFVAALSVVALGGCATSLTMERISPSDHYADYVKAVNSAYREPSGTVVLCVFGEPAQTPSPFGHSDTDFSIAIPPAMPPADSQLRPNQVPEFRVGAVNVRRACADERAAGATAVPVHRVDAGASSRYFYLNYAKLMSELGPDADGESVWAITDSGYPRLFYISEQPQFQGKRAVAITTSEREVTGRPGYAALLPFAVVYDVLLSPVYLFMALTGIPHGR